MRDRLILLADPDRAAADELKQALGEGWVTTCVESGTAALEELQKRTFAAAIVSLRLKDVPPEHLLNQIREYYPKVLRFVVATEKDRKRLIEETLAAHRFLVRPFGTAGLQSALEGVLEAEHWIPGDPLRELIAQMRALPTVPALYLDIINSLNDASSTTEDVGELIGKDLAITSKLLQVINSPYFGLPRAVTSPSESVGLLGFATTQALVVAVGLLSEYERLESNHCPIEQLWAHGATVARAAKGLALLQTGEGPLADEAFAAGLLHDIGKAVLAGNFPAQCARTELLARTNQCPLFEAEREVFGAHHGDVGAYLLTLWALPSGVVSAAAWHHEPLGSGDKQFSALTAVHAANALSYVSKGPAAGTAPIVNRAYLSKIGMEEFLRTWCEEVLGIELADRYLLPQGPEAGQRTELL
jgi:HD-like signal output (HDOD) protein